jgi:phage terminase large subunit
VTFSAIIYVIHWLWAYFAHGLILCVVMATKVDPKILAQFKVWRENPVQFVRDQFGVEPDGWQKRVLMAAVTHNRIAMCSCKGPGKTCVLAWLILWFIACYPSARMLATSVSRDNLRDNLWAEIAKWLRKSKMLSNTFDWHAERVSNKKEPENWFCSARAWPRGADPNAQATTLQGLHDDYTMAVLDESGGIPSAVMVTAEASLGTGIKNIVIQAGNPEVQDGPLWDACNRDRNQWYVEYITGDPDDPNRASRVKIDWARSEIEKWGRDNPWVLTNVFGRFPPTSSDKLLSAADIDAAFGRTYVPEQLEVYPVVYGVDVAKSLTRNRSTLWRRQGPLATLLGEWRLDKTIQLANAISTILMQEQQKGVEIQAINVDNGGLSGVAEFLVQLGWTQVIPVDNSWPANDPRFFSIRSEMWWKMAQDVKKTLCLQHNVALKLELMAPKVEYKIVGNKGTRFLLESKESMQDRGVQSPDLGDGLALTYFADLAMKEDYKSKKIRARQSKALTAYDPLAMPEDQRPQDDDEEVYRNGYS